MSRGLLKRFSNYEIAKMTRQTVAEFDETYIDKYIPADILAKMHEQEAWFNDEGFHCGFRYVHAGNCPSTGRPYVCMGARPYESKANDCIDCSGMYQLLVICPPSKSTEIINVMPAMSASATATAASAVNK